MQRYFAVLDNENNIVISLDDIFHITKVMRMNINDEFEVNVDGDLKIAKITSLKPFSFKIVKEINENHELNGFVRLLYCLPKGEKTDLVIQKAVELGCSEIVLINSERSIAKITKTVRFPRHFCHGLFSNHYTRFCQKMQLVHPTAFDSFRD